MVRVSYTGALAIFFVWAAIAPKAHADAATAITVQGESPTRANIPTATHSQASGGAYLALDTVQAPPAQGWHATYEIDAAKAGVHRLDAVLTSPAVPDRRPFGGSQFNLSINGAPFVQVAKSEPYWAGRCEDPPSEPPPAGVCEVWAEHAPAWGSLIHARLDDVELRRGPNTITFMVDERRSSAAPQLDRPTGPPTPAVFRFFLDEFTLTPTELALKSVHVGDPAVDLGTYRGRERARLRFELNAHARERETVSYRITDYFAEEVVAGTARIAAGATSTVVDLPELPPGNYQANASLASSSDPDIVGYFARLPGREPVAGRANRFGVTTSVPWLVPSSRLEAFAAAMSDMGAGYAREEISWPLAEHQPGRYDTRALDRIAQVFREHGIRTLGAWWNIAGSGDAEAPSWAMSETSAPLPDDLRDGYAFARHVAGQADGIGRDALELWNEPAGHTGDRHAAYLKAAALGVADSGNNPLVSLPGVFWSGEAPDPFQTLMLQNDVARYADIWAFHHYAFPYRPGGRTEFPAATQNDIQHALKRLYAPAIPSKWATEAGIFAIRPSSGVDLGRSQQVDQARYLVQSTVQDLAGGTDKHFWFSGAPYCANGFGCFGLLSSDFQPLPSYSAHAALASTLGRADFVQRVEGLPANVTAFLFKDEARAVTVLWADSPTQVDVPTRGGRVQAYDIMGARTSPQRLHGGAVRVTASPDPIYLVTNGGGRLRAKPRPNDSRDRRQRSISRAEHIVLSQRFSAENPAPEADDGTTGYLLGDTTQMSVDVYNFNRSPETVTVAGHAWGGWSARGGQTVVVPPNGRATVPFTVTAGDEVRRRVDYPLVIEARVAGEDVPPSVSRIQHRDGALGQPVPLAPSIDRVSPADGSTARGPEVKLSARIVDSLSGIDPEGVVVSVDGRRVPSEFNPSTGSLVASLRLSPGDHEISIRAVNRAYARAQALANVVVVR